MAVTLDMMEYEDDAVVQLAYVSSDDGLIDYDPETNYDQAAIMTTSTAYSRCGQALTLGEVTIATAVFYLQKNNSPTGNAYAEIWAATGTIGTNAVPTGGVLATSNAVDVSTIDTSYELVTFTFASPYEASAGDYVVMCHWENGDETDNISFGRDMDGSEHAGNWADEHNSGWRAYADGEAIFYLYGSPPLQSYSENTIKTQGSYSLKGVAVITDSLDDTLTRTI